MASKLKTFTTTSFEVELDRHTYSNAEYRFACQEYEQGTGWIRFGIEESTEQPSGDPVMSWIFGLMTPSDARAIADALSKVADEVDAVAKAGGDPKFRRQMESTKQN